MFQYFRLKFLFEEKLFIITIVVDDGIGIVTVLRGKKRFLIFNFMFA